MPTKQAPAEINVRLTLPAADHQRLRLAAATERKPMSEYSRDAVLAAITRTLARKGA